MAFRFRRSMKLAPGVRLNFSKSGVGWSLGGTGYRVGRSSTGKTYRSMGVPGTGLYDFEYLDRGDSKDSTRGTGTVSSRERWTSASGAAPPSRWAEFSSAGEKRLFDAINAADWGAIESVIYEFPDYSVLAAAMVGVKQTEGDKRRATELLEWVMQTGEDPGSHPFIAKYEAPTVNVAVAPGVSATIPIGRTAVGLALAELYQESTEVGRAIGVVESLEPVGAVAVSAAELYIAAERFDDIIKMTDGIENKDDETAFLLVARGCALRQKGLLDAARTTLNAALRSKKRAPEIRYRALMERSRTHAASGKKSAARRDLERIIAEDASVPGVTEMLADLG